MTEWQPIETAPRDGTSFLAFDGYQSEVCCYCDYDYWCERARGVLPIYIFSDRTRAFCDATHWHPLPKPPQ